MRISEIWDQLQELGEVMSNREMTIVVLNALLEEGVTLLQVFIGKKKLLHSRIYGHYARLKNLD